MCDICLDVFLSMLIIPLTYITGLIVQEDGYGEYYNLGFILGLFSSLLVALIVLISVL